MKYFGYSLGMTAFPYLLSFFTKGSSATIDRSLITNNTQELTNPSNTKQHSTIAGNLASTKLPVSITNSGYASLDKYDDIIKNFASNNFSVKNQETLSRFVLSAQGEQQESLNYQNNVEVCNKRHTERGDSHIDGISSLVAKCAKTKKLYDSIESTHILNRNDRVAASQDVYPVEVVDHNSGTQIGAFSDKGYVWHRGDLYINFIGEYFKLKVDKRYHDLNLTHNSSCWDFVDAQGQKYTDSIEFNRTMEDRPLSLLSSNNKLKIKEFTRICENNIDGLNNNSSLPTKLKIQQHRTPKPEGVSITDTSGNKVGEAKAEYSLCFASPGNIEQAQIYYYNPLQQNSLIQIPAIRILPPVCPVYIPDVDDGNINFANIVGYQRGYYNMKDPGNKNIVVFPISFKINNTKESLKFINEYRHNITKITNSNNNSIPSLIVNDNAPNVELKVGKLLDDRGTSNPADDVFALELKVDGSTMELQNTVYIVFCNQNGSYNLGEIKYGENNAIGYPINNHVILEKINGNQYNSCNLNIFDSKDLSHTRIITSINCMYVRDQKNNIPSFAKYNNGTVFHISDMKNSQNCDAQDTTRYTAVLRDTDKNEIGILTDTYHIVTNNKTLYYMYHSSFNNSPSTIFSNHIHVNRYSTDPSKIIITSLNNNNITIPISTQEEGYNELDTSKGRPIPTGEDNDTNDHTNIYIGAGIAGGMLAVVGVILAALRCKNNKKDTHENTSDNQYCNNGRVSVLLEGGYPTKAYIKFDQEYNTYNLSSVQDSNSNDHRESWGSRTSAENHIYEEIDHIYQNTGNIYENIDETNRNDPIHENTQPMGSEISQNDPIH